MASTSPQMHKGIVKQALSGDCVVVRGQPKGGPPPEQQIALSNVVAPKVGRRANPNIEASMETRDEPYAWESREYLRSRLVGKEIMFTIEYKPPGSGRVYGSVFVKKSDGELVSITESLVSEGLVEVRRGGIKPSDDQTKLIDLEEAAKNLKKGKWADDANEHVRNITWNIENPRNFVDQKRGKPVDAIVEMVRDGSTIRAFVLPTFEYVTILMTGIKCPMFKLDGDKQAPELFAEEAKFFTESRLLQREIQIQFEGVSNQNFLASIIHPAGNIAELMLREGFARCVDWSMGVLSSGHDKYRQAEKSAKQKQLRIWKGYTPSATTTLSIKESEFCGKVVEVVNADAVVVMMPSKEFKKIFFSSLRPPRALPKEDDSQENGPSRDGKRGKPLYDVPHMFEAREFLRKKLIGKKVDIKIDYIKPANDGYPERTCATVTISGINVAEALISKGLATTLRHRQDDDQRSSQYDDLLAAENRAAKNGKGLHSKKEAPIHRVADISGDRAKASQFLPFLQRAGKSSGIVEFVGSGSRFRLYLPKETCQITFLLAGISCPKVRTVTPQGNVINEGEPFGDVAMAFSKEHCLQREVEVQVESIDRAGNFIGWMFVDGVNLSADLIEHGLSKVHFTAERSSFYKDLSTKEQKAKDANLNIWKGYVEEKIETVVEESERKTNFLKVIVTEVVEGVNFWAQNVDTADRFEQMMLQLRSDLTNNPPLPGSISPRKGDMCAGLFIDNLWYRVKVEKVDSPDQVHVLYLDYGNRDVISSTKMAALPPTYHSFAPQAHEYNLACLLPPSDEDDKVALAEAFKRGALNEQFNLNIEYKLNGQETYVTLSKTDKKDDIALSLLTEGYAMVEKRKEKRLQPLLTSYRKAQEQARRNRVNLWQYGDFTEDDAPEFGFR